MSRRDPKAMSKNELENYIKSNSNNNGSKVNKLNSHPPIEITKLSYVETAEEIADHYNLNYNYLNPNIDDLKDTSRQQTEQTIPGMNEGDNNHQLLILKLNRENNELKQDIQKLFHLSDSNKRELEMKLKQFSDENFQLKHQNTELKNQMILNENMINNSNTDKAEGIKEKQLLKANYENEIIELNKQLSEYKARLNKMTYEYQNLNDNYNYWRNCHCQSKKDCNDFFAMQKYFEDDTKNYIKEYENDIDEIHKKLCYIENCNSEINSHLREMPVRDVAFTKENIKPQLISPKGITKQNTTLSLNNNTKKSKLTSSASICNSDSRMKRNRSFKSSIPSNKSLNPKSNGGALSSATHEKMYYLQDEMFVLERKIAELSRNYQNFLSKLKDVPFTSFKENEEIKKSIKYISQTLKEKTDRLIALKEKQQSYLLNSIRGNKKQLK